MKSTSLLAGAAAAVALTCAVNSARATPYSSTFSVSAWTGPCFTGTYHTCSSTDSTQQALPSNPLIASGNKLGSFTFTGPIDFDVSSQSSNTYGDFLQPHTDISGFTGANGHTLSGFYSTVLSTGSYGFEHYAQTTSIMEFTFTTGSALSGTIDHDDGVSLYSHGNTSNDLLPTSASSPTTAELTNFSIGPGTYDLFYVEANGAPAVLQISVDPPTVPEPGSLTLLATALLGAAAIFRYAPLSRTNTLRA